MNQLPIVEDTGLSKLDQASRMLAEVRDVNGALHAMAIADAAAAYASRMNLGGSAITAAVELRVDATKILGGFLINAPRQRRGRPKKGAAGEPFPTLEDLGLTKKQSSEAQKVAKLSDVDFAVFKAQRVELALGLKPKAGGLVDDQDTDECYTPAEWLERGRKVTGGFDVDPFSCAEAQKTVQAARFFTKEDDGLAQEWNGRVWYQPPYSAPIVKQAAEKLVAEVDAGRTTEFVGLTNTCTSSDWWQLLAARSLVVHFPDQRINFARLIAGELVVQKGNRADQTFFYFGPNPHAFEHVFGEHGVFGRMRGGEV